MHDRQNKVLGDRRAEGRDTHSPPPLQYPSGALDFSRLVTIHSDGPWSVCGTVETEEAMPGFSTEFKASPDQHAGKESQGCRTNDPGYDKVHTAALRGQEQDIGNMDSVWLSVFVDGCEWNFARTTDP